MTFQKTKCARVTEDLLERVGIPRRYRNLNLDFYGKEPALMAHLAKLKSEALNWLETGENLLIMGTYGTGKTGFACQMLQEALEYGARVFFVSCPDLVAVWNSKEMYDENVTYKDKILKSDMIVLDDMDPADQDHRFHQAVAMIVKARYEDKRSTIITTVGDWKMPQLGKTKTMALIQRSYMVLILRNQLVGNKIPNE